MNAQLTPKVILYPFLAQLWPSVLMPDPQEQKLLLPAGEKLAYLLQESGYMHIQATKPQTVGGYLIFPFFKEMIKTPNVFNKNDPCI